ncbi:S-adenosyl-L-methionine-dependent methyltransferase [Colletotrichum eremochloae]|nr:S-adenosyl-L-methionine-dependent methyltransferase [Colletotrichum eremochloae]
MSTSPGDSTAQVPASTFTDITESPVSTSPCDTTTNPENAPYPDETSDSETESRLGRQSWSASTFTRSTESPIGTSPRNTICEPANTSSSPAENTISGAQNSPDITVTQLTNIPAVADDLGSEVSSTPENSTVEPLGNTITEVMEPIVDPLPVDPALEDFDDPFDSESILTSSTVSVTESVRNYRELHGRSFTQKTDYWGPNDEQANDALDFNHHWVTALLDAQLFLAPIEGGIQNVLDIGTGTGIWAIDFADNFPSAEVIGIDISPIQPPWVPPNCRFQIADFEKEWTFTKSFDFIHARNLEGCISDLPKFLEECFNHTSQGGWLEILECDIEVHSQTLDLDEDHIFKKWHQYMLSSSKIMGKPHGNASKLANGFVDSGYVDVVERIWTVPIGAWPAEIEKKSLGLCCLDYLDQSLEGFALLLLREVLDFTYDEVQTTVATMRSALRNPKNTPFYHMHVIYGRKP